MIGNPIIFIEFLRNIHKYDLNHGSLRTQYGFDLAGILCNMHAQSTNGVWLKENNVYSYLGETKLLPLQVAQWANTKPISHFILNDELLTLHCLTARNLSKEEIQTIILNDKLIP